MASNREKLKELNAKNRLEQLENNDLGDTPIENVLENIKEEKYISQEKNNYTNINNVKSRFGVDKIEKPLKDAQVGFRIPKDVHEKFKKIVSEMYYPDKPNYNETMNQILKAFISEYENNR